MPEHKCAGIYNDETGELTTFGQVVMDAWVFEIIPASENCEGWDDSRMQALSDEVSAAWQPYENSPRNLPDDLRMRHAMIHEQARMHGERPDWDENIDGDD